MAESIAPVAVGQLRQALAEMKKSMLWSQIVDPRDAVLARFQPIFQPSYIPALTVEEFKPFLYFENNQHWSSLHRQVNRICSDLPRLRQALAILVDESRPIEERLDELDGYSKGLGKGIMTAILTVTYPDKYGVWNNVSEAGLKQLKIWPEFAWGLSFGSRYLRVNSILRGLADALEIDLWTLDALWWQVSREDVPPGGIDKSVPGSPLPPDIPSTQQFGLERHLHDFLYDNWDQTEIGKDWTIYTEPGDDEAGYEYACPIGRIDILARHRREKRWLVVELKRADTSDSVLGQVLRYIGWVKHHLAKGDEVHGLIIAREVDDALRYAISVVPNLRFQTYEVEFRLKSCPAIGAGDIGHGG